MPIYDWGAFRTEYIEIKFSDSLATSTLINPNFTLYNMSTGTPASVLDPFKPIVVTRDFYSISRTLRLWFNVDLISLTDYQLSINGLKTIANHVIDPDTFDFKTGEIIPPVLVPPIIDPVDPGDGSIEYPCFPGSYDLNVNNTSVARLVGPIVDEGYYLSPTALEGRIDIQFDQSPAANYVTTDYFKVQRKLISRQISRWESVSALVTADTVNNRIYIYMPSSDSIPLYGEPDKIYWEPGYKYRVKILSGIGV